MNRSRRVSLSTLVGGIACLALGAAGIVPEPIRLPFMVIGFVGIWLA